MNLKEVHEKLNNEALVRRNRVDLASKWKKKIV